MKNLTQTETLKAFSLRQGTRHKIGFQVQANVVRQ